MKAWKGEGEGGGEGEGEGEGEGVGEGEGEGEGQGEDEDEDEDEDKGEAGRTGRSADCEGCHQHAGFHDSRHGDVPVLEGIAAIPRSYWRYRKTTRRTEHKNMLPLRSAPERPSLRGALDHR